MFKTLIPITVLAFAPVSEAKTHAPGMLNLLSAADVVAASTEVEALRREALEVETLLNRKYAYIDRLPLGRFALTSLLRREAENLGSRRELLRFLERALMLLADHHAITGASLKDSWAVFPSYGDLWIERRGSEFVVESVRAESPAQKAGIKAGDHLLAVDDVPIGQAVKDFWSDLGSDSSESNDGYASRVLAAGRRDRARRLTIGRDGSPSRVIELPSLYSIPSENRSPVSTRLDNESLVIRINDSLGSDATIAAFDSAMASARPKQSIIIDLTETPSGGNTVVARAIMGWFVKKASPYQIHNLPAEERETGIPRQWVEQVLPREGKYHQGKVTIRVGRWTGSMGEGLAIGFAALGAKIEGSRMAGLLGAIYDYKLPNSGIILKVPSERLYSVDGTRRELFVPRR